mmetsp:Transcript_30389/g.69960  ORF Transcript_30389/g.69960 Transcript_30389/m.69960 type:complete len:439 (+) Transcript_30389:95-1411(+)
MLGDLLPDRSGENQALVIKFVDGKREFEKVFTQKPIGFQTKKTWFSGQAEVGTVEPKSHAASLSVKRGWLLAAIRGQDISKMRYPDVVKLLKQEEAKIVSSSGQGNSAREVSFAADSPRGGPPPRGRSGSQQGGQLMRGPAPHHAGGRRNIAEGIRSLLVEAGTSQELLTFWTEWDVRVVQKALGSCRQLAVLLSSDTKSVEVQMTGGAGHYMSLIRQFVNDTGIPSQPLEEIEMFEGELEPGLVTLWCRFRHLGGTERQPSIDAGVTLLTEKMPWQVADLLMHDIGEQDTLREFAMEELDSLLEPSWYSASIFPLEPEKGLHFDLAEDARTIASSFMVFKVMGFNKPHDATVKLLSTCLAQKKSFAVFMGPSGLTRIVLRLEDMSKFTAYELTESVHGRYHEALIEQVGTWFGMEQPNVIDFVADSRGYSIGVGFQL